MAKETYAYTVQRTGYKRALIRGRIVRSTLEKAVKAIQRKFKTAVTKQHMSLFLTLWNVEDETERFEQQYMTKKDFRKFRKPPKWRKALTRKAKYSSTFDPTPTAWFVALGKRGQIDLTKLAYEPTKQSLLRRKRKRLFGPFDDEAAAHAFIEKVKQRVERRETQFSQGRRYKGPMDTEEGRRDGNEESDEKGNEEGK